MFRIFLRPASGEMCTCIFQDSGSDKSLLRIAPVEQQRASGSTALFAVEAIGATGCNRKQDAVVADLRVAIERVDRIVDEDNEPRATAACSWPCRKIRHTCPHA